MFKMPQIGQEPFGFSCRPDTDRFSWLWAQFGGGMFLHQGAITRLELEFPNIPTLPSVLMQNLCER